MKCQECGLELMIYQVTTNAKGEEEVEYACRNPRCGCYDKRLTRKAAAPAGGIAPCPHGQFLLFGWRAPAAGGASAAVSEHTDDHHSPAGRRKRPEYGERRTIT